MLEKLRNYSRSPASTTVPIIKNPRPDNSLRAGFSFFTTLVTHRVTLFNFFEKSLGVSCSQSCQLLKIHIQHQRCIAGSVFHIARIIALAAKGHGRLIRAVRFKEHELFRHILHNLAHLLGVLIGGGAAKAKVIATLGQLLGHF